MRRWEGPGCAALQGSAGSAPCELLCVGHQAAGTEPCSLPAFPALLLGCMGWSEVGVRAAEAACWRHCALLQHPAWDRSCRAAGCSRKCSWGVLRWFPEPGSW